VTDPVSWLDNYRRCPERLLVGPYVRTSADGVDAVLCRIFDPAPAGDLAVCVNPKWRRRHARPGSRHGVIEAPGPDDRYVVNSASTSGSRADRDHLPVLGNFVLGGELSRRSPATDHGALSAGSKRASARRSPSP
jgi:hypothetical protein